MIIKRALIVFLFICGGYILLASSLYKIQIIKGEEYKVIADNQQNKSLPLNAERGLVYDKNNELIVYNRNEISFYVDTRMMTEERKDTIVKTLSKKFGKSIKHYLNMIENGKRNICLEEKVSKDKALELLNFVVDGFYYQDDYSRVYPYGRLASHILGYVNSEYKGIEGIEKYYDENLTGKDGTLLIEKDVLGRMVTIADNFTIPSIPGDKIYLTIDRNIQKILEEELSRGVKEFGASSGVGIIMDPNSGQIISIANVPDFDPNIYNKFSNDGRRNRAIIDTYEPGSTIKPLVLSILLNEDLTSLDEIINTENGSYKYKGVSIHDTHPFEKLSVSEILEQSSNIGMAKISSRIKPDIFYKYLRDFGFGNVGAITLPGESKGLLKKPANYSGITIPFIAQGYEISVTPLQLVTAFSALINGGTLYRPYVVSKIVNSEGLNVLENEPLALRKVITTEISSNMRSILRNVVINGTGKNANVEEITVGGKTGTSQKLIGKSYSKDHYNSSFIGFYPVENPKFICLVLLNSPSEGKYGGLAAAPVFKNITNRILQTNIGIELKSKFSTPERIAESISSKNVKTISANNEELQNSEVNKYLQKEHGMPNLLGLTIREASALLNQLKVKYKFKGTGKIISQSIKPGQKINKNTVCELTCNSEKLRTVNLY